MSLTSSCPGTDELKSMLRDVGDRVGARFVMLIGSDGTLEGCVGLDDAAYSSVRRETNPTPLVSGAEALLLRR